MTDYYTTHGSGGGGGYMHGSQGSPSGSPGGTKKPSISLRPVVCKQVLEATRNTGDNDVLIDGVEATQLTFVAQVLSVQIQATNMMLKLDDGTGQVETRQWIEQGPNADVEQMKLNQGCIENHWVRVLGNVKHFSGKRHFAAQHVRPVTDWHEIYFALLEALSVHLQYTKGPPAGSASGAIVGNSMADYTPASSGGGQQDPWADLPPMEKKIVYYIINSAPPEDGIHVSALTKGLGSNVNAAEVSDALEKLTEAGHIFNTVDEYHYNVSM
ncbi:replication factor A protein 2 [Tulasnella sp. JGI-2019a]|nr:replication factor A protein 2 [Tulasnella sp. JGI-2019a]KAG9014575.1 replication factor A protein 2 [Tulasnella sp. JGI-2019a]KAG9038911.1 replication factor A protein 2 [Tulasnella sp. JGI-2019a]